MLASKDTLPFYLVSYRLASMLSNVSIYHYLFCKYCYITLQTIYSVATSTPYKLFSVIKASRKTCRKNFDEEKVFSATNWILNKSFDMKSWRVYQIRLAANLPLKSLSLYKDKKWTSSSTNSNKSSDKKSWQKDQIKLEAKLPLLLTLSVYNYVTMIKNGVLNKSRYQIR